MEAASAEEALEICRRRRPDIIISDWMMPGMSGLEFCRELRALDDDGYVYFILLTSKSEKEELADALRERGGRLPVQAPSAATNCAPGSTPGSGMLRMERELRREEPPRLPPRWSGCAT